MVKKIYTPEVKAKAVELALAGENFKIIQTNIGPNPKATVRYLLKAGYTEEQIDEIKKKQKPAFKDKTPKYKRQK